MICWLFLKSSKGSVPINNLISGLIELINEIYFYIVRIFNIVPNSTALIYPIDILSGI